MRRWTLTLVILAGCRFQVDWSDTRYTCADPPHQCPVGYACVEGLCTTGEGEPSDDPPDAAPSPAPDAAAPPPPPPPAVEHLVIEGVDTYLNEALPMTNFGADPEVSIDADPRMVGLLRFEVALPPGATITGASLRMSFFDPFETGGIEAYPLLEAWVEAEATWSERAAGVPWAAIGGAGSLTPVATVTPSLIGEYVVDLPVSLVEAWAADPASNHGLRLVSTSMTGRGGQFVSSEGTPPDQRVRLVVDYLP